MITAEEYAVIAKMTTAERINYVKTELYVNLSDGVQYNPAQILRIVKDKSGEGIRPAMHIAERLLIEIEKETQDEKVTKALEEFRTHYARYNY